MRGWQVVRHSRLWPRRDRQRKTKHALPHYPNTRRSLRCLTKELETRNLRQRRRDWKCRDAFLIERVHDRRVRVGQLAEESGRLLPLAIPRDVSVVNASECKDRKQVRIAAIVVL